MNEDITILENEYGDVFTKDINYFKDEDFVKFKKNNMNYWDEIEGIVEDSFIEIAKYAGIDIETISDYEHIKSITELYISCLEERYNVKFPIVTED